MTARSMARRVSVAPFATLLGMLLIAHPGHAERGKRPAYKTFTKGKSVNAAFRSLLRQGPLRGRYRANKAKAKVRGAINEGLGSGVMVPMLGTYAAGGGYASGLFARVTTDALANGNAVELGFGATMAALSVACTVASVGLVRSAAGSTRASFATARRRRNAARKATIGELIGSTALQRKINGGAPLSAPDLASLAALADAL